MSIQQVIRHVRTVDPFSFPDAPHNLGGATVIFDIDHKNNLVKARWSVCSEEINFSKKEGIKRALAREPMIVFDISMVDKARGLIPALCANLEIIKVQNDPEFCSEWMEEIIKDAYYTYPSLSWVSYDILRETLREFEARKSR